MEKCSICNNKIKVITDDYPVQTQSTGKGKVFKANVKNIRFYQCTFCEFKEIIEEDKGYLEMVRKYFSDRSDNEDYNEQEKAPENGFKSLLKKVGIF